MVAFLLVLGPLESRAHGTTSLCVQIVDQQSKIAVTGARIFLIGAGKGESFTVETDSRGKACFDGLHTEVYRLTVQHARYEIFRTNIQAFSGKVVSLDIKIAETLKTIARITANPHSHGQVHETITPVSTISKVNPDLLSALMSIPGLEISQGANGIGAVGAINGLDRSMTSYTINGASVSDAAALSINTDLLSRAEIDSQNDTLNFFFLSPTQQPTYTGSAQAGGYGALALKATAQGTSGVVGFALAHSIRTAASALNGQTYADQSGMTYRHTGELSVFGNYGTVSVPLSSWNISLSDPISTSRKVPISDYFDGPLPAGFGPGEKLTAVSSNPLLAINGFQGKNAISVSAAGWDLHTTDDYSSRVVSGVPLPSLSNATVRGDDFFLAIGRADDNGSTRISFDAKNSMYSFSALSVPKIARTVSESTLSLSKNKKLSKKFSARVTASLLSAIGHVSPTASATLTWSSAPESAYASLNIGRRFADGTSLAGAIGLGDPTVANFNCSSQTITALGIGADSAAPTSFGIAMGYSRQFKNASITLSGYDQQLSRTLISDASVAASALPLAEVSPAYIAQLQQAYSVVGGCTTPPPSPQNIFFVQNVSGVSVDYRGLKLHATVPVAKRVGLDLRYALTQALVTAIPNELIFRNSPYVEGFQIPNVPLNTVDATIDWQPSDRFEVVTNVYSVASNNVNNLPGYAQFNAGVLFKLSKNSTLSLVGSNLTNRYVGYFVSPVYSVPFPTYGGQPLPTLAAPLGHSALFAQLHIALGDME